MNTLNTKSAAFDIQSLLNLQGQQDILKIWASMNERIAAVFIEAGTRSIDIMSSTSKEALSNLRDATQVRDESVDYGKAYSDFAQKQVALLVRTAQDVGDVTQKAGTKTTELASRAGEELSAKVTANVEGAADKVAAKATDVADKAGSDSKKSA